MSAEVMAPASADLEVVPVAPRPPGGPAIWFSVDEAAEVLGVGADKVRRRCERGLPHEVHDGAIWIQLVHLSIAPVPTA